MPRRKRPAHLISILVPIGGHDVYRTVNWEWVRAYLEFHLGDKIEIVVGRDRRRWSRDRRPFSKTIAVNNAFHRSHGDIVCVMDADVYIDADVITHCADRIRAARKRGIKLWFVPYREIYRLTPEATGELIDSPPWHPLRFSDPPPPHDVEGHEASGPSNGRDYGAMITIMGREAFECVGGMEPRARGWGADDLCFLQALDALYSWPNGHKNTPNDVLHLWHPRIDAQDVADRSPWRTRMWAEQETPGSNDWLAMCYNVASKSPKSMRKLVDEGLGRRKP